METVPPKTSCLQCPPLSSPPPFSSACPEATQPSATSIPGVATATRVPSTDGAFRRSSGPLAAVPLLVPISVSATVPLSVAVSSSPGSANRRAAFLLPYLQPLFLLLLALLLLLLFLLLVPSFALLLPLCAVQKPLYRLVDTTVSLHAVKSQPRTETDRCSHAHTNLLLGMGKPVYTWSRFGLQEQVI